MSTSLKYVKRLIGELSDEEYQELATDVLANLDEDDVTEAEEMNLVMMSEFTEDALQLYRNFGQMQGISTGYPKVDRLTLGLVPGELILVAGKTSRGKTTLALNIASNVALEGHTVLFVTLEMTHKEITSRTMFITGCEGDELTEDYHSVAARTVFQVQDELKWTSIDSLMKKAKEDMGVDLVVIDHLHYFTRELQNVSEDLGRITKEFKKNAIRHEVPVMLISHVRKTQNDAEATMDDMRGSSYMAQDADVVLMVGRLKENPSITHVKIEKNRNRGFDYEHNTAELYTDKIKIYNSEPVNVPDFDNDQLTMDDL